MQREKTNWAINVEMNLYSCTPGNKNKGKETALVWHEKASRTALKASSLTHKHTLLVQPHNMLQSGKLQNSVVKCN